MSILFRLLGRNPPASTPSRPVPRGPVPDIGYTQPPGLAPAEPTQLDEPGLVATFTQDHAACDRLWADVEGAEDASSLRETWAVFETALRRHLAWEEQVLFPAFEEVSPMRGMGPTEVMRGEHVQMRAILDQLAGLAAVGDQQGVVDQGDTLLMLIQQHNAKEEGMLYPMIASTLGPDWDTLRPRLRDGMR